MMKTERRHQTERIKANRKRNGHTWVGSDRTPAKCSCWMCGNPRKYFSELTIQEKRFAATEKWNNT